MSCWVVPSVAAELWGCTIDAVMHAVRSGNVPSKEDSGWMFIDVAPDSPMMAAPKPREEISTLYTSPQWVVSSAEQKALESAPSAPAFAVTAETDDAPEYAEAETTEEPLPTIADWRTVRQDVAASRRAPLSQAA